MSKCRTLIIRPILHLLSDLVLCDQISELPVDRWQAQYFSANFGACNKIDTFNDQWSITTVPCVHARFHVDQHLTPNQCAPCNFILQDSSLGYKLLLDRNYMTN